MKQIQDKFDPNLFFLVFEKNDAVHLGFDGHKTLKIKIDSCNGKNCKVPCCVDENGVVHWGKSNRMNKENN